MDFYRSLNYSFGNEDWQVEKTALSVAAGDKVLCVTASGDRALHLLLTPCKQVISIDVNQSQTALLELKMLTFDRFDYEKSLVFFGCKQSKNRLQLYDEIKAHLSNTARKYWDHHPKKIKHGVLFQGRTEKLCRIAALILNFTRKNLNERLFAFDNIVEQRQFIDNVWDTPGFRKIFEIAFYPKIFKLMSNDPGITAFTEYTNNAGVYLYNKMLTYLRYHLARKSALLQLIFTGTVPAEAYLPYLTYEGYETIRKRLSLIDFKTTNIITFLQEAGASEFNCFSMSDIASYMPQSAFEQLLLGIKSAAAPNARFCLRELLSKRNIPVELMTTFKRDAILEQALERDESNFVYRFIAGQVC